MAIIGKFRCYICGKEFKMAYGNLLSNRRPPLRKRICPKCKDNQEALEGNGEEEYFLFYGNRK